MLAAPPRPNLSVVTKLGLALALALLTPAAAWAAPFASRIPEAVLIAVTLNGQEQPDPVLFLRDAAGALYAPADVFRTWRLDLPPGEPIRSDGIIWHPLNALPGTKVAFSEADQAVQVDARPEVFAAQEVTIRRADNVPMTPSASGAFLSYDLFADYVQGRTSVSGGFDAGFFSRRGILSTSFIGAAAAGSRKLVRLDTSYLIDRPGDLTSLRFGDAVSSAGAGTVPVRFAGVRYSRNFTVQPGFLTAPLPSASGSATVPSVVDVYVNNMFTSSQQVAPGLFTLANIPVNSGGGNLRVVVRDLLGRERILEESFYSSSTLLRRGLHDFSYETGFLRRSFGERSFAYGKPFVSTTHRYGFTNKLTGEANMQASASRQVAGVGATLLAFDLGQVWGSGSVSRSKRGTGYRVTGSVERAAARFSFGARAEYTSARYAYLGLPMDFRLPRYTLQAFADVPVPYGSLGLNFVHRGARLGRDESVAGLSSQVQLRKLGSLSLFARRTLSEGGRTEVGLNFAVSLGGQHSASAGFERGNRGIAGYFALQKNPPLGPGAGYRVSTSFGEARVSEAAYTYNLPAASVGARLAQANGTTGIRLSAVGGIGFINKDVFATRDIGESFARVTVADISGVRVYADNQLVGVTGKKGVLVVPNLRPFEANKIRIDDSDLPFDTRLGATEILVRPYARAGASVRFHVERERGVLMQVRLEDGQPLPAGARVTGLGIDEALIAVGSGEVYAPGLAGRATLTAAWAEGRCSFEATVPLDNNPQPRLDGLLCRSVIGERR